MAPEILAITDVVHFTQSSAETNSHDYLIRVRCATARQPVKDKVNALLKNKGLTTVTLFGTAPMKQQIQRPAKELYYAMRVAAAEMLDSEVNTVRLEVITRWPQNYHNPHFLLHGYNGEVLAAALFDEQESQLVVLVRDPVPVNGIAIPAKNLIAVFVHGQSRWEEAYPHPIVLKPVSRSQIEDIAEQVWGHNEGQYEPREPKHRQAPATAASGGSSAATPAQQSAIVGGGPPRSRGAGKGKGRGKGKSHSKKQAIARLLG
jgi:hypothetical protein